MHCVMYLEVGIMVQVNIDEVRAALTCLVENAADGEPFVIVKSGWNAVSPVAKNIVE